MARKSTQHSALATQTEPPETESIGAPVVEASGVMVEIPVASRDESSGYASRGLRSLNFPHANILRDITRGLIDDGATLASGKAVQTSDDALVWILDQVAAGRK